MIPLYSYDLRTVKPRSPRRWLDLVSYLLNQFHGEIFSVRAGLAGLGVWCFREQDPKLIVVASASAGWAGRLRRGESDELFR